MDAAETIAAVATAPGRGGIGIIRISGPLAASISRDVTGTVLPARVAVYRAFRDANGGTIDEGLALWFPGPDSFTGEDVLELHGHGGPVVLDLLLARVTQLKARLARPGEFTERAFLNGKMDLAQAEAVADLIDAASAAAAKGSVRTLQGVFSKRVHELAENLVVLRAWLEGTLDFPDEEDVGGISITELTIRLDELLALRDALAADAQQGALLRDGVNVAIMGSPNVGKSSLLNALSGKDEAIVTDIPGTTRDLVRASVHLDGVPVHLVDTAGLRFTEDPVERLGIERAHQAGGSADLVLNVLDACSQDRTMFEGVDQGASVTVRNKVDLTGDPPGFHAGAINVSALTGAGMAELRAAVRDRVGLRDSTEGLFTARRRHLDALERAGTFLAHARSTCDTVVALELVAEDLRLAQNALGEITGEFTSEDLLGEIFATFCIGK